MSALDAFVNAEWMRVCAPRVKPPKLDRLAVPVSARPEDFATLQVATDDFMRQIDHATRPANSLMEAAVRMVFALGYQPADCRIDMLSDYGSLDKGSIETRRLYVLGQPCFEIEVRFSPMVDLKFTITTAPRLIAWPPAREGCTPEHQHPLMTDA